MYHSRLRKVMTEQRVLHTVMLELTYRCNLDCFYCYNDKEAAGTPLSFEQYIQLFEDMAEMQTLFLTFTGGEPMVHPRFFDLGEAAKKLGFAVRLRTNGHTLTPKIARRVMEKVDPYAVEMSIHGATAESHDRQTRVPGSFQRLVDNIRGMKDLGVPQELVCTPTAWNEHELDALFELVDKLGIKLHFQGPVGPRDNGDTEPLLIQPSKEAWVKLKAIQAQRYLADQDIEVVSVVDLQDSSGCDDAEKSADRACSIGRLGVDIDPMGNVYPCMHLKQSAGSLHQQSIQDIWYGANGMAVLAQAEQLSIDAASRFDGAPMEQFGAPVFCPAIEVNCAKGCASKASAS
jgi:MoaA/NifB/PqqE/SkfB family radical SAM enzyme